jgi:hypothetical protein
MGNMDDPLPAFKGGFFVVGVSSVAPSLGVNVFVLGVVIRVGYRPTGSFEAREANPLPGAPPQAPNTYAKLKLIKPNAVKPTQQNNPAINGEG